MRYHLVTVGIAVASVASMASASSVHRRKMHAHHDHVAWISDINIKTVVDWKTVWANNIPNANPAVTVGTSGDITTLIALVSTPTPGQSTGADSSAVGSSADGDSSDGSTDESGSDENSDPDSGNSPDDNASSSSAPSTTPSAIESTTLATGGKDEEPTRASAPLATSGKLANTTTSLFADGLTPNGRKGGLSGYLGIQKLDAFNNLAPYISWYSDYTPNPPSTGNVQGIGMLWGASGSPCGNEVSQRLKAFKSAMTLDIPDIMFGFYEPDCYCGDSSQMSSSDGVSQWNALIKPLAQKGAKLGSPSMCKQKDETWLQDFKEAGVDWDVTSVHINKPDLEGVKEDIEYYASTYGKPIWVSEFACVHDQDSWQPCTDQNEINQFINDAVKFFQGNETVVAYGPSNGNGLGNTWPLTDAQGSLTESGRTYLNAIKGM